MRWFVVSAADNRVIGWHDSPKATELPAATASLGYFECSPEDVATLVALQKEALADGREPVVLRDPTGELRLPPDTRPLFRVEVDNTAPMVGETINATVTRLDDPAFIGTFDAELVSGRLFRLDFVDGVATRTFAFAESGVQRLVSSPSFKLETPVEFRVAE